MPFPVFFLRKHISLPQLLSPKTKTVKEKENQDTNAEVTHRCSGYVIVTMKQNWREQMKAGERTLSNTLKHCYPPKTLGDT